MENFRTVESKSMTVDFDKKQHKKQLLKSTVKKKKKLTSSLKTPPNQFQIDPHFLVLALISSSAASFAVSGYPSSPLRDPTTIAVGCC